MLGGAPRFWIERASIAFFYPLPWFCRAIRELAPGSSFESIDVEHPGRSEVGDQLRRMASIGFEERHIARFLERSDDLVVRISRPGGSTTLAATSFCSVYTSYNGIGSLVINLAAGDGALSVDEIVALIHSADGRPLDDDKNGAPGGALEVNFAGARLVSLQCAALQLICRFRDQVQENCHPIAVKADEVVNGSDIARAWHRHPFSKPRRSVEIASAELDHASSGTEHATALYGILAGDEGWRFYPSDTAKDIVRKNVWRSREFFQILAFGRTGLLINNKPDVYVEAQDQWWQSMFGYRSAYFDRSYSIAGMDHGLFRMLENCVASASLQERVRANTVAYLTSLDKRRRAIASPYEPTEPRAGGLSSLFRLFSPRSLTSDLSNVAWLTSRRASIFKIRVQIIDDVDHLTTLRIREFGDLARLIRGEQGIEANTKSIRLRLQEVDAEFNVLSSSSNNSLLFFLAITGAIFAFTSLVWQSPAFDAGAHTPLLSRLVAFAASYHPIAELFARTVAAFLVVLAVGLPWTILFLGVSAIWLLLNKPPPD